MHSTFAGFSEIKIRDKALVVGDIGSGKTRFCREDGSAPPTTAGYEYHATRHESIELRLTSGLCYSYEVELAVCELSGPRASELARRREFTSNSLYIFVYRPGAMDQIWSYWLPLVLSELEREGRTFRSIFPIFVEAHVDEDKSGASPTALRMRSEIAIYQRLETSRFLYFQTSGLPQESKIAWSVIVRQAAVRDLWERGFLPQHLV